MSTFAEIEAAIDGLPPEDFRTFHAWKTQRVAAEQIGLLAQWLDTEPEVPVGP